EALDVEGAPGRHDVAPLAGRTISTIDDVESIDRSHDLEGAGGVILDADRVAVPALTEYVVPARREQGGQWIPVVIDHADRERSPVHGKHAGVGQPETAAGRRANAGFVVVANGHQADQMGAVAYEAHFTHPTVSLFTPARRQAR